MTPLTLLVLTPTFTSIYSTVSYNFPPNRSRKPSESVTEATKKAWISQTKDFTTIASPRKNAWFQTPKIIQPKFTQKSDNRSASTLNTAVHRNSISNNIESHGIQSWISQSCKRPWTGSHLLAHNSICIHLNRLYSNVD